MNLNNLTAVFRVNSLKVLNQASITGGQDTVASFLFRKCDTIFAPLN